MAFTAISSGKGEPVCWEVRGLKFSIYYPEGRGREAGEGRGKIQGDRCNRRPSHGKEREIGKAQKTFEFLEIPLRSGRRRKRGGGRERDRCGI